MGEVDGMPRLPLGGGGIVRLRQCYRIGCQAKSQTKKPLLTGCLTASYVLGRQTSGKSLKLSRVGGQSFRFGVRMCPPAHIYRIPTLNISSHIFALSKKFYTMSDRTTRKGKNILVKKQDDGTKVKIKFTDRGTAKEVVKGPGMRKSKIKINTNKGKVKLNTDKSAINIAKDIQDLSQLAKKRKLKKQKRK